jgi:hypothetical protein
MSTIPKHEATAAPRKGHRKQPQPAAVAAPAAPVAVDLGGVEVELGRLAGLFNTYVGNACKGENFLGLFSEVGAYPVRVELVESEASEALHCIATTLDKLDHLELLGKSAERIATAFERIATALEGKAA